MTNIQKEISQTLGPIKRALDEKYNIKIFDKPRLQEYVKARQFFIGYVLKNYNFSLNQLSIYMNLNPSTLISTRRKFANHVLYDKSFEEDFANVSCELDNIKGFITSKQKYNIKKRIMDKDLFKADEEQVNYVFNLLYNNPLIQDKQKAATLKSR